MGGDQFFFKKDTLKSHIMRRLVSFACTTLPKTKKQKNGSEFPFTSKTTLQTSNNAKGEIAFPSKMPPQTSNNVWRRERHFSIKNAHPPTTNDTWVGHSSTLLCILQFALQPCVLLHKYWVRAFYKSSVGLLMSQNLVSKKQNR